MLLQFNPLISSACFLGISRSCSPWKFRRVVGQLSLVEFLLVIALGSAVGAPMFYPDVPLLHAMAVVAVIVLLNRGLNRLIIQSGHIERLVEGTPVPLVQAGLIQYQNLNESLIGQSPIWTDAVTTPPGDAEES